jgi:hypothetical protein
MLNGRSFYFATPGLTILDPCIETTLEDPMLFLALPAGYDVPLLLTAPKQDPNQMTIEGEPFIPKYMHNEFLHSPRVRVPRDRDGEFILGDIEILAKSFVDDKMVKTSRRRKNGMFWY